MKISLQILVVTAVIVFGGNQQANAQDDKLPSAESILQKYVDVTGGAEKYKSIKSMKATGTLSIPTQGISGKLEVITVMPNKVVAEIEIDGFGKTKRGSDGKVCWEDSTMMGARLITGKEATEMIEQSDMTRIYDPAKFFKSMKTVGKEKVGDEECYKVELVTQSGDKIESYYSIESGLELKTVRESQTQMGPMKIESFSMDYREVDGLKSAFKVEQKLTEAISQIISLDNVEYNADVADDAFEVTESIQKLIDKEEAKKAEKEPVGAGSDK